MILIEKPKLRCGKIPAYAQSLPRRGGHRPGRGTERLVSMHDAAYDAYMRSPAWEAQRHARLRFDGFRCTGCSSDGSDSRLEVHHLTYERFGHERLTDLVTLCHVCHCAEHGLTPTIGQLPIAGPGHREFAERAAMARKQQVDLALAERATWPLWKRLRALEDAYRRGATSIEPDLRVIQQRVQKVHRIAETGA